MVLLGLKLPPVLANSITYVLAVVVLHLGIVANPGFFSHDEWQKYDHVHTLGIVDYIYAYGRVTSGSEFGYPVRPLGFIQQGISALAMRSSPVIPHLFDVLLHAAIGLLLVATLHKANADHRMSWLAGVMFAISPLTTFATAWVAASFDQWSTLFWLAAAYLTVSVIKDGAKWWSLSMMATISSLAILSKENALVMPVVIPLVALALRDSKVPDRANRMQVALLFAAATVPLLAYLAIRFPAIQSSVNGGVAGSYTPSGTHISRNLVDYVSYPFLPRLIELAEIARIPVYWIAGAFLLHGVLIVSVWREFGATRAAIYCFSFLSYILLVLVLPATSPHYLYGSALPMSIALAALWVMAIDRRRSKLLIVLVCMTTILAIHNFNIQRSMYQTGVCQSRFIDSLETAIRIDPTLKQVGLRLVGEPGAPIHVVQRVLFGRDRYEALDHMPISFSPDAAGVQLTVTSECTLR